jgi:hypothetical protein
MHPIRMISQSGRVIARVFVNPQGERYTFKTIRASKHMLRLPEPSFAYDDFVLAQAVSHGVAYHVIKDEESDLSWCAWHWQFEANGKALNHGHGRQTRLALRFWEAGTEPTETPVIELFAPKQLELFGDEQERAA